ncbi:hypothetical protein [Streptomyces sp. NRRL S-646]|uniref:MmyB family transcriptional regulator n=1 Tax=Streptomyces sp. NRRL S-646 TaxID=1463917 RepID=UPI003B633728
MWAMQWSGAAPCRCSQPGGVRITSPGWASRIFPPRACGKALTDLIGELVPRSEDFRTAWARHNMRLHYTGLKHIRLPAGWAATADGALLQGVPDQPAPSSTRPVNEAQVTIIGCLSVRVVDAMCGMITQVRPPRRDDTNANYRALPLCDPGRLQPHRRSGEAAA